MSCILASWWNVRWFAIMLALVSVAFACDCLPVGVKEDSSRSTAIFRGVVTNLKELPVRRESSRSRYEVTFTVSEYWKGPTTKHMTLHILKRGTDCIGARFDLGKEYVVFAVSQEADDFWLEKHFWFGWLDVLPKGSRFLTANNYCDSTAEVKQAGKTLTGLGKGRKL
jgi:hypothetical protein